MRRTRTIYSKLTAKQPWFLASRRRLFLTLFLALAVPAVVLIILSAIYVSGTLRRKAVEQNLLNCRLVARHLQDEFAGLRQYVESYARRPSLVESIVAKDHENLQQHLVELAEENPKISRAVFVDPNGILLFDFPPDDTVRGRSFAYRDWFKGVSQTEGSYISEVYHRAALGQIPVVMIATAVVDRTGNLLGYLGGQYALADLAKWLENIKRTGTGNITFLDHGGRQALHDEAVPQISDHPAIATIRQLEHGSIRLRDFGGNADTLVAFNRVPNLGWTVISYQPTELLFAPVHHLLRWHALLFVLVLGATGLLGWQWFKMIHAYSEDLTRSNKELEKFCYSIAHEFRAPLRAMRGFTGLLTEEYGPQLDKPAQDYSRRIHEAAARMDRLVNDLLIYGGIAHTPLNFQRVDLDDQVRSAVMTLETEIAQSNAAIDVQRPLGSASADATLLDSVLYHLIANAIKHVAEDTRPIINISATREHGRVFVRIQDNGVGVAPELHEKIFGVFQRLRADPHDAATGIGLAIVHKAIERMGGRVGVESTPGAGSCFWFELPEE